MKISKDLLKPITNGKVMIKCFTEEKSKQFVEVAGKNLSSNYTVEMSKLRKQKNPS